MSDLDLVRRLAAEDSGLAVVALVRKDGTVQATVVNAGILDHPVSGTPVVGFVTRGDSYKLRRLRARMLPTVTFRAGWEWVSVEGRAEVAGPDDPLEGLASDEVPALLRAIFTAAGGTHEDWDTFDRVMAQERRAAVLIHPKRIYSNP